MPVLFRPSVPIKGSLTARRRACSHAGMSPASPQPRLPLPLPADDAGKEPLQVRIPVVVKRRFKAHAAMRGLEPHELFVEVWGFYEREHSKAPGGEA